MSIEKNEEKIVIVTSLPYQEQKKVMYNSRNFFMITTAYRKLHQGEQMKLLCATLKQSGKVSVLLLLGTDQSSAIDL